MDDKTQKERLEQELRFLKESFEAEVISKEEFEKGKNRIEKKLLEIGKLIKDLTKEQNIEEPKKQDIEKQEKVEAAKNDISMAKETEKIKLNVIQDVAKDSETILTQKIEQKEPPKEPVTQKLPIVEGEKNKGRFLKYTFVFIILIIIIFFSYSSLKNTKKPSPYMENEVKFVVVCSSDDDCKQKGKEGTCLNPETINAECIYKDAGKTKVVILNDKENCFNCDTQRVLSILENWFGVIDSKEIDYNTIEGLNLAEKLDANLLPVYILSENITKKPEFENFKQAFIKKDDNYILSDHAAGSNFYFRRDLIQNKLDFFVKEGDNTSIKAESNVKEFLEAFQDIKFEKHLPNNQLTKELDIKNFPAFLVNNKVRFSGVYTADSIKNNFCKLNKVPSCEKNLSKNLI